MIKRLLSTSTKYFRMDPATFAGPNMMTKMLRKQKIQIEKHKQRLQNNQKPPASKSKPNKLKFQDTDKTKAFNLLFQQNLLLVLHSPSFNHHFVNSGLTITKVRVTPSFADVFVYWKSRNLQDTEELEEILDSKAADIRYEIEELKDLGQIPKITFVRNNSEALPIPSAKEIEEILTRQIDNSETLESETESENESNEEHEKQLAYVQTLEKRTDVLGFDRQSVIEKVQRTLRSYPPREENS